MDQPAMKILEKISAVAVDYAKERGFECLGAPGERHGSWELTFQRRASRVGDPDRFVVLAFTLTPGSCDIEFWAGAEARNRYVRRLVSQSARSQKRLNTRATLKSMMKALGLAIEIADRLESSDLVDAYLLPRTRALAAGASS